MKWNKKICVEYLTKMRSPIEETMNLQSSGVSPMDVQGNAMAKLLEEAKARRGGDGGVSLQ